MPLILLALALCGCADDASKKAAQEATLKAQGKVAAANLKLIREAAEKFFAARKVPPESMDELGDYGAELAEDPNYSALAYGFAGLKFGADGKLTEGTIFATPMAGKSAPDVAMNAATGEISYKYRPPPMPGESTNAPKDIQIVK